MLRGSWGERNACLNSEVVIQDWGGLTVLPWLVLWADCCPAEPEAVEGCNMMRSSCAPSTPAGEIGQVGQATYLHGFTAAVGILRAQPSEAQG